MEKLVSLHVLCTEKRGDLVDRARIQEFKYLLFFKDKNVAIQMIDISGR